MVTLIFLQNATKPKPTMWCHSEARGPFNLVVSNIFTEHPAQIECRKGACKEVFMQTHTHPHTETITGESLRAHPPLRLPPLDDRTTCFFQLDGLIRFRFKLIVFGIFGTSCFVFPALFSFSSILHTNVPYVSRFFLKKRNRFVPQVCAN